VVVAYLAVVVVLFTTINLVVDVLYRVLDPARASGGRRLNARLAWRTSCARARLPRLPWCSRSSRWQRCWRRGSRRRTPTTSCRSTCWTRGCARRGERGGRPPLLAGHRRAGARPRLAILYGLRISLAVGIGSALLAAVLGTLVGLAAASARRARGRRAHAPGGPAAVLSHHPHGADDPGLLGKGIGNVVLTLVLVEWAYYARTARGQALVETRRDYVEAARGLGLGAVRIALAHVLPNCLPPLMVIAALQVARAITLEATLSFLGRGRCR
jgi:ABC-type dipeptide/oligopeptide/nickel transport system permease subunit